MAIDEKNKPPKPEMITVILTSDESIINQFGGICERISIAGNNLELPNEAKQRAGFDLEISLARKLVQVCPLYRIQTPLGEKVRL